MNQVQQLHPPQDTAEFAHESEKRIAELFDFYGIAWEYEPETFVLSQGADGLPTSAFTPDFYLPDHDIYLEVTTMRQPLVTRKNRKRRQLREQRPDIEIRILYQRDVARLFSRHAA